MVFELPQLSDQIRHDQIKQFFSIFFPVLVFPALVKVPEYDAEDRKLSVPNELNHSYCLRIETRAQNSRTWTVVEPCVTAENGVITLDRTDLTDVNVSICLVYRPEVCGEPVACKISKYMLLYIVSVSNKIRCFGVAFCLPTILF